MSLRPSPTTRRLMRAARDLLRARGLRQQDVARDLGVSLPTLKRWLAGRGVSLDAVVKLAELLDVEVRELVERAALESERRFQYTEAQEQAFVDNPGLLSLFERLLERGSGRLGRTADETGPQSQRLLLLLDRLGLIELHPEGRFRTSVRGEPVWLPNGPLQRRYGKEALSRLARSADRAADAATVRAYRLSPADTERLRPKVDELFRLARELEMRAAALGQSRRRYGMLFLCTPFEWELPKGRAGNRR